MTIAWYDPTNHHVSTDKDDPLFTPLGQLWPLNLQRPWVGLTEEETQAVAKQARSKDHAVTLTNKLIKEKNT